MILLKKPYKPIMFTGLSASFNVYGKSFMQLQAVYLSGAPLSGTTFYNPFSAVPKLSAAYPGFTAYKLLSSEYTTNFDNTITINVPAPINFGYIDVIAQNPAGYGALTRFVVKELYSGSLTQQQLRPWSEGVVVYLSGAEGNILAIDGSFLTTISGEYLTQLDPNSFDILAIDGSFLATISGEYITQIQ